MLHKSEYMFKCIRWMSSMPSSFRIRFNAFSFNCAFFLFDFLSPDRFSFGSYSQVSSVHTVSLYTYALPTKEELRCSSIWCTLSINNLWHIFAWNDTIHQHTHTHTRMCHLHHLEMENIFSSIEPKHIRRALWLEEDCPIASYFLLLLCSFYVMLSRSNPA